MFYLLYLLSVLVGGLGAWLIKKFGAKLNLIDLPNGRSSHSEPTPKGGGIGILFAFVLTSLFLQVPLSLWLPGFLLALMSFFGDRIVFSPILRLSFQIFAALVFVVGVREFQANHIGGFVLSTFFIVFAVGTANLYNFMDGINGISSITGIVGFALLAFTKSFSDGCEIFVVLSFCVSFSCLGFLPFNFPKAKVFIGDVGSILLGFLFASLVILFSEGFLDFICFASFLFPYYADGLTTMAIRIRDRENLLHPHRRHLYQLLANEKNISHWKISVGYGLFQLIIGITVLLARTYGSVAVSFTLGAYFSIFILVSFVVRKGLTK